VKPPPFEYHAPATVEEALQLLADGNGTHALAGGQSLLQLMKFKQVRPNALVDLNGVSGLDVLEEREGELHVGALVRQQRLLEDDLVAERWPLLREAARFVGYKETRRRGTVCGSLAFAAPWAELTAAAVALDAQIDVRSANGERTIPARSFFRGPNATALEPGELIVRVRFPAPPARSGAAFHEVSARYRDYCQVAAAAVVSLDGSAELVLLRVATAPYRVDASSALKDEGALAGLLAGIEPEDDIEVSAAHRRRVAPVLARRALAEAAERARQQEKT
jgi:aerobic carbon-monoxide dehydrogenase medium subunit